MDPRNFSKSAKFFTILLGNLILLPLAFLLFVLRVFFRIKFVRLMSNRIGHLAENTDLLLRRKRLYKPKDELRYIGIAGTKPSSKQLLKMFKREMAIIQIPEFIHRNIMFRSLSDNPLSVLNYADLFKRLSCSPNESYEFNNASPTLRFTGEEEKEGRALLDKTGVNSWFVCFHARDPLYISLKLGVKGKSQYNYTDCDISNYLKAAEYITQSGGFALRMGELTEKKLHSEGSRLIDYASNYRTDFGDIYLLAKCKFFLGNCSGIYLVPAIFNVPVAMANFPCFSAPPLREEDLFIPKKVYSRKKKGFLSFREILEMDFSAFHRKEDYEKEGLELVENSPEEIMDLTVEMNERIDGVWKTTDEDERLQREFYSIFKKMNDTNSERRAYNSPARVGSLFLRKNRELLEGG